MQPPNTKESVEEESAVWMGRKGKEIRNKESERREAAIVGLVWFGSGRERGLIVIARGSLPYHAMPSYILKSSALRGIAISDSQKGMHGHNLPFIL